MSPSRPEPIRVALARRAPLGPAPNPAAPLRYGLPDDHAAPSPPRRPRCNLPARCDAPPARISVRPSTDDASTSTPVDGSDGHDAAGSQRVADGPDADCGPPPDGRARDRGSPHEPDREPIRRSVHRPDAAWRG